MIYNHLATAFQVIPQQAISYSAFVGRAVNDVGLEVNTYAAPVDLKANVQAVQRSVYEQMGLDFQKKYVTVYIESKLLDLNRDTSSDKFTFAGETYQTQSNMDWYDVDGWTSFLAVRID